MLYDDLVNNEIIIHGNFTLKSGKKSNYYVNIKKTFSIPKLFNKIINSLSEKISKINDLEKCCIIGIPTSGIPFASAISYKLNIPFILLRDKQKKYGTKKLFEGEIGDKNIILIEDVMTTGGSIIETIDIFEDLGYNVKYVFTIFQRGKLDYYIFKNRNINYNYLLSINKSLINKLIELIPLHPIYNKLYEISYSKKSNLILSVDKTNVDIFKNIIIKCSQYIVAVKVHMDIFRDEDRNDIRQFLYINKFKYNFLVIEDRKFGDICNTNLQQYEALKVEEYADIVICHAISGFKFTKYINLPILLVSQLSNDGNLIDNKYTDNCINGVMNNYNIIGCISQKI